MADYDPLRCMCAVDRSLGAVDIEGDEPDGRPAGFALHEFLAGEEPMRAASCTGVERLWPSTLSIQMENAGQAVGVNGLYAGSGRGVNEKARFQQLRVVIG